MWRRTAFFVAWLLAHATALTCSGQDRSVTPLPAQCPVVRFEIVMGRLTALHLNAGQTRASRGSDSDDETRETMHVNCEGAVPIVRYERHSATWRISIEFTDSCCVSMRRESLGDPECTPLELQQLSNGELTVTVGVGDKQRKWSAASFWHLLLAEPRVCEQEIVPLLKLLRPAWDFTDAAERIETALYQAADSGEIVPRTRLADLVNELGHRDFQRRQAADRRLSAVGPTVLPYLSTLDRTSLNCEQRQRIQRIRDSMANAAADTPDRIALWLVDDEQVWVTLLAHRDAQKRHLAALRLMEIRPEMTNFDPYGDELYRQTQLAQLKLALCRP